MGSKSASNTVVLGVLSAGAAKATAHAGARPPRINTSSPLADTIRGFDQTALTAITTAALAWRATCPDVSGEGDDAETDALTSTIDAALARIGSSGPRLEASYLKARKRRSARR